MTVLVPCLRCPVGLVALSAASWTTRQGLRRSVWVEEPAHCSRGCALTSAQVERLLVSAYEAPAHQLPLFGEPIGLVS